MSYATHEGFEDRGDPETSLLKKEQDLAVTAIIEGLPPLFREVLVLKDIEDMPIASDLLDAHHLPLSFPQRHLLRA
jgi:DNA-directed RNA polymerase specialized sigma24 family protein